MRRHPYIIASAVLLITVSGCIGGGGGASPSGVCGAAKGGRQRMICTSAVRYTESRLGVEGVQVIRFRIGGGSGDCAMAEVSTTLGFRRVLFAASGKPGEDLWQPFAVSDAFRWEDYVPDSDVLCGLYNAGLYSSKDLPKTGHATA